MHSVVQGKELHKDALIIIMYVIPRCGKIPFTFVLLQVIERSWCTMKQRFSILLYSGVHAFQSIRLETPCSPNLCTDQNCSDGLQLILVDFKV